MDYEVDRDMTTLRPTSSLEHLLTSLLRTVYEFTRGITSIFFLFYNKKLHFDLCHYSSSFLRLYCVQSTNLLEALLQSSFSFTTRSYTSTSATTQVASYVSTAYGLRNRSRYDKKLHFDLFHHLNIFLRLYCVRTTK